MLVKASFSNPSQHAIGFRYIAITILFLLSLLSFQSSSYAGVWSDIEACLDDPCNCGDANTVQETWGGTTTDKGKKNRLCPPWNKGAGRENGTCLVKSSYPQPWDGWFMLNCAELTKESTYFSPKIRIRNQSCNAFSCWHKVTTLRGDGQCLVWPGPWAYPPIRICARMALPDNPAENLPADPGYTYGKHLNDEGFEEDDEKLEGDDGQKFSVNKPKLCAYKDPSLYDIAVGDVDLMDYNPVKQLLHRTSALHPIAKVIIFFIQATANTLSGITDMIASLFDSLSNSVESGTDKLDNALGNDPSAMIVTAPGVALSGGLDVLKETFKFIGEVIKYVKDTFISIIQELGQFNRVVDESLGCVDIPLGPYPPPYCPEIQPFVPSPTTQAVCVMGNVNDPVPVEFVASTSDNKCVVSQSVNNVINNTVRVTFDNFVPLCSKGENPQTTDKCVNLSNVGPITSASVLHATTARRDLLPKCGNGSGACIDTKIDQPSQGFRVVYALNTGSTSTPSGYFLDDVPDCSPATSINCQKIWGVNTGEFIDVTMAFPSDQSGPPTILPPKTFSLNDLNKNARTFSASIVNSPTPILNGESVQTPEQICVVEGQNLVGCEKREPLPKPKLSSCSQGYYGISCTDDYFNPQFIASIERINPVTKARYSSSARINPLSYKNFFNFISKANLAGYEFSSFVTDDNYTVQPFTGPNAINPTSIHGTYKGGMAYNQAGATYLYGLEYLTGMYVEGGTRACLQMEDVRQCNLFSDEDRKLCVLTNLKNRDTVDCKIFAEKAQRYRNLRMCKDTDIICLVNTETIAGKSGGPGITIKQCPTDYCYINNKDPGQEVCVVSSKASDRFDPVYDPNTPGLGDVLDDDKYFSNTANNLSSGYNYTEYQEKKKLGATNFSSSLVSGYDYDKSLYSLRTKTSIELGLCVPVPQPKCAAKTENGVNWPEGTVGQQVTGSCPIGWVPNDLSVPLTRYCLAKVDSGTIIFDDIPSSVGCRVAASITFTSNSDNFPGAYSRSIPNGIFVGPSNGISTFGTQDLSYNISTGGYYTSLNFSISNIAFVDHFTLESIKSEGPVLVRVNGQRVYSAIGSFSSLSYGGKTWLGTDYARTGGSTVDEVSWALSLLVYGGSISSGNINLLPYLQNGNNNITVDFVSFGNQALYYKLNFGMR